jgi:hypothetical protein
MELASVAFEPSAKNSKGMQERDDLFYLQVQHHDKMYMIVPLIHLQLVY